MRRVLIILFILLFIPFKANALDFNSEAADGDKIYICGTLIFILLNTMIWQVVNIRVC